MKRNKINKFTKHFEFFVLIITIILLSFYDSGSKDFIRRTQQDLLDNSEIVIHITYKNSKNSTTFEVENIYRNWTNENVTEILDTKIHIKPYLSKAKDIFPAEAIVFLKKGPKTKAHISAT